MNNPLTKKIENSYQPIRDYINYISQKAKDILNYNVTPKQGLAALFCSLILSGCQTQKSKEIPTNYNSPIERKITGWASDWVPEVPETVKEFIRLLEKSPDKTEKPIVVRLSKNSFGYMVTYRDLTSVESLSEMLGIHILPAESYDNLDPVFPDLYTPLLNKLLNKYDSNDDHILGVEDQDRIGWIYINEGKVLD